MYLRTELEKVLEEPVLRTLKEVKADPFSLESLIAWLETMPADEVYCFIDTGNCLNCQYLSVVHGAQVTAGSAIYNVWDVSKGYWGPNIDLPPHFNAIANGHGKPRTFGAALTRAQAALERLSQSNPQRGEI